MSVGFLHAAGAQEAAPARRTGSVVTALGLGHGGARAVAVQGDGRIVAAGPQGNGRKHEFGVVRYTTDGRLDTTFNGRGFVTISLGEVDDVVGGLGIQPDGKIVVGGTSNPKGVSQPGFRPHVFSLVRYTTDGQLDAGFGDGGKVFTPVTKNEMAFASALVIQPDGKIVVAGQALTDHRWPLPMSRYDFAVARYLPDGRLDPTFGRHGVAVAALSSTSEDAVGALVLQPDGKILVAGQTHGRYQADIGMLRLNADGTRDRGFGSDGQVVTRWKDGSHASGVAVQGDGKILLVGGGMDEKKSYGRLVRYRADGGPDSGFGEGGVLKTTMGHRAIAVQPDGKVVAAGSSPTGIAIFRYLPDGRLDPDFGSGGIAAARVGPGRATTEALALQGDGKIVAAGSSEAGGLRAFTIIRYNFDGSLDTTFGDPARSR